MEMQYGFMQLTLICEMVHSLVVEFYICTRMLKFPVGFRLPVGTLFRQPSSSIVAGKLTLIASSDITAHCSSFSA